jgi:Cu2+-exporting ATPase
VVAGKRLFKKGLLLKSGDALERLAKVDTIVFDKTGTLTAGAISFENPHDFTAKELMIAASLAANSRHPLSVAASAIFKHKISLQAQEIDGKGVKAELDGKILRLGSAKFTGAQVCDDEKMELWLSIGTDAPKRLIFSDLPHEDAVQTIAALSKTCHIIMLSGDRTAASQNTARLCGITDVRANLDPKQKYAVITDEIAKGHTALMVGDGLNDAAALTCATVSMSPASALDITQNAADIVYRQKGIASVLYALETARAAQNGVRQNFILALGYNVIAIPLAVAGYVTPLVAAVAMSVSSLVVIFNALRIGRE